MDGSPLLWGQQLVATEAYDQTSIACRLEHRDDRVSVGREQQTVPQQVPARVRADQVELATDRDAMPVGDLEMLENELLPFALVGFRERAGHAQRDRQRRLDAGAPADARRHGEQQRGVAPP